MDHDQVDALDTARADASLPATMRRWDVQEPAAARTTVSEDGTCVVWLVGEHDVASSIALSSMLSGALDAAGSGLVVDLSGVRFMSAATIGAVLGARSGARRCGLTFMVRSPSPQALRVLGICGLLELIDPVVVGPVQGSALASWVTVPPAVRVYVALSEDGVGPSGLGSGATESPVGRAVEMSTDRGQAPSLAACGR